MHNVAIVGAGIAGMATAARLQAQGLSTIVFEAHGQPGGWRRLALARPFIGLLAFALAAYAGAWWLEPFLVFLIFVAVVTVTHGVVHGSLGLNRRQTDWALFVLGAILLESGHAYRATHIRHHHISRP
jgi:fatty acid desaturase